MVKMAVGPEEILIGGVLAEGGTLGGEEGAEIKAEAIEGKAMRRLERLLATNAKKWAILQIDAH